jgi:hypothetical protein
MGFWGKKKGYCRRKKNKGKKAMGEKERGPKNPKLRDLISDLARLSRPAPARSPSFCFISVRAR